MPLLCLCSGETGGGSCFAVLPSLALALSSCASSFCACCAPLRLVAEGSTLPGIALVALTAPAPAALPARRGALEDWEVGGGVAMPDPGVDVRKCAMATVAYSVCGVCGVSLRSVPFTERREEAGVSAEPLLLGVATLEGVTALAPDDGATEASRLDETSGVPLKLEGDARIRFAGDRLAPCSPSESEAWRRRKDVIGRRRKRTAMRYSITAPAGTEPSGGPRGAGRLEARRQAQRTFSDLARFFDFTGLTPLQ